VWAPWGSPNTQAGTVVTARWASQPAASAGRPPQSLGADAKDGVTFGDTTVMCRDSTTLRATTAAVAGARPVPGTETPAAALAVVPGATREMTPTHTAVTASPVPTLAQRTRIRARAWRIGFSKRK